MITRGRLPQFRGGFGGFGLDPAPAITPGYIPPGATYASFPGIEGIWRLYSGSAPVGIIEFSTVSGALTGRIKFSEGGFNYPKKIFQQAYQLIPNYPPNVWLDLYRVSLDFERNKLTFRFYEVPQSFTFPSTGGKVISKVDAEASVVGNQLIGRFEMETDGEYYTKPEPVQTSFWGFSGIEPRWSKEGLKATEVHQSYPMYPGYFDIPGAPFHLRPSVYRAPLIYWNAIKESQPAFVPALVVIRSPTPGVTIEVTVPVITVPLAPVAAVPAKPPTPPAIPIVTVPTQAEYPPSQITLPSPSSQIEPTGTQLVEISEKERRELYPLGDEEVSSILKAGMPPLAWVALIGASLFMLFGAKKKGGKGGGI